MDNSNEDIKKVREEVREATHMDGVLEKLAKSLSSGVPIESRTSASNQKTGSIVEPEPEHLDINNLANLVNIDNSSSEESPASHYKVGKEGKLLISNPMKKQSSNESTQQSAIPDFGDLNGIVYSILTFPFSKQRDKEITTLQKSIDKQANKVRSAAIMNNTQKMIKSASNFYVVDDGGIRMEFTILGQKYSMKAKGPFTGKECLYPTVDGDTVIGLIMKEQNGNLINATNNFKIEIKKGWKGSG